jgi:hypothetical protein
MSRPGAAHASVRPAMESRQKLLVVAALCAVSAVSAQRALAQTSACDRLKATLSARIDPSRGPFTLEAVPAGEAPAGSKVIGTCEGGARQIVLRRGASAPASAPVRAASAPATVAAAVAAPPPPPAPVAPTSSPAPADEAERAAQLTPPETPVSSLFDRLKPWIAGALLLVLAAWLRARLAYRRAYDEAGLPRGPKLD